MNLKDRNAVVTGAGRGIGAAIARALSDAGASVLLAARTESEVAAVAEDLRAKGGRAEAARCDVSRPEEIEALAGRAGIVDILVNNAGIADSAPVKAISLEDWNRLLAVNATGTFLCTKAFLPGMIERKWGRVVNIASVAGLSGAAYIAAYSASKHAVVGFTRAAAAEAAPHGVTVNAVCPGYVDTPMTERSVDRISAKTGRPREEALERIRKTNPQGRIIGPEEVAFVTLMLCDEGARGINGQAIVIDGGAHLS